MLKSILYIFLFILVILSCAPKKITKPSEEASAPIETYFTGTVIRDNINIRSTSSTNGSILGNVKDGEQVQVIQNNNGWYEIITTEKVKGWIRSDFVGTKSMSYSIRSENFADSTLQDSNVKMFIDEQNPYEIIYMILPDNYYTDKNRAENLVKQLGLKYQQKVYPGRVEIRILSRDKKSVFSKVILDKKGAVDLKAPFLLYGHLYSFNVFNGHSLDIKVLVPPGLPDDTMYDMSTDISSNYGNDIHKIEIFFIEDTIDGRNYLSHSSYKPKEKNTCRFYYLEDSNGPDYKSNFCN